jgi:hypothetical protein
MIDFILEQKIKDLTICDKLINYHKNSLYKYAGTNSNIVDITKKASTDVQINNSNINTELIQSYLKELKIVCDAYIKKYKYCNDYYPWDIVESFNIQHYKPNEGYFAWHTERGCNIHPMNNRHLVFMTYLNDVDDGGETEFYHQKLKVKAEKGKTVIFPADWTHTHRGITSPSQNKYIITGWYNFTNKGN